jgi:hypothetical protein
MKNILFTQWNLFRAIRLILGIGAIIQGIVNVEMILVIAGIIISGMAVLNVGCCGATGCSVPPNRKQKLKEEEITYEEVVK